MRKEIGPQQLEEATREWIALAAERCGVYMTDFEVRKLAEVILYNAERLIANELMVLESLHCRPAQAH